MPTAGSRTSSPGSPSAWSSSSTCSCWAWGCWASSASTWAEEAGPVVYIRAAAIGIWGSVLVAGLIRVGNGVTVLGDELVPRGTGCNWPCLLYTSDAADEEDSVDLGGRRIIKKK